MKHELVSYPPTLFESEDLLLGVSKSVLLLATSIREKTGMVDETEQSDDSSFQYIIDGGMLLHSTYHQMGEQLNLRPDMFIVLFMGDKVPSCYSGI